MKHLTINLKEKVINMRLEEIKEKRDQANREITKILEKLTLETQCQINNVEIKVHKGINETTIPIVNIALEF